MINQLTDIKNSGNWQDAQEQLGRLINLDGPAPAAVVHRALADDKFACYLIMTKDSPVLREQLLNDPRNKEFEEKAEIKEFSNRELLVKASGALVKWAKAGFTEVDKLVYEKRIAACTACPHLKKPSAKAVYLISKLAGGKQAVCGLCGCVASRKAKLPSETCPAKDPLNPEINRWGEPL